MSGMNLDRKKFESGQPLFLEGDEGHTAYLIEEGAIMVYKKQADGQEKSIAVLKRGDILGEMSLIDDEARAASAKALETCTVAMIPREMFEQRLAKSDPIVRMLLKVFVQRLRDATHKAINAPKENW